MVDWTANDEGLTVSAGALGRSEGLVEGDLRCVRVREGFLLYVTEAIWHWLPDSGFESPDRRAVLPPS